ncbi:hypothetical protein [Patulibacter defluvii]|uniref:hypothetical protein n=1 Tax=Patulibacter defluvii TaxID=3095358 RepID=UPI002A764B06|nr:hypothetical protein [Patulibacter sp. DM4]
MSSRSLRDRSAQVDPLLAVVVGGALVVGGGLAVWGSGQDTAPVANDPAAALTAPGDDALTARALQAVAAANRDGAVPVTTEATALRQARRASASGRTTDPFARGAAAVAQAATASTPSGGSGTSVADKARNAVATANAASNAAAGGATATTSVTPTTPVTSPATGPTAVGGGSVQDQRRVLAKLAPRVSMRVKTSASRRSRSRLKLGTLLPNSRHAVARIVDVSASGKVVTLRLDRGVTLPHPQSKGTVCVARFRDGAKGCRLVHVRAGRTAVLRAPERRGEPGDVTAVRILAVWRGQVRLTAR